MTSYDAKVIVGIGRLRSEDQGGHAVGLPLQIQQPGEMLLRQSVTCQLKYGRVYTYTHTLSLVIIVMSYRSIGGSFCGGGTKLYFLP